MAIQVKVMVRKNSMTGENLASASIVNLQQMEFAEFCDYLAQDSTVGAADVAAVMTQLEKKLPLLIGMGTKVQISQEGMTVKPTVSGSLTQSALKAKLEAKKAAGEDVDVSRELKASDGGSSSGSSSSSSSSTDSSDKGSSSDKDTDTDDSGEY